MHLVLAISLVLFYIINGQKTPYTWIDFDTIHNSGLWENTNAVRTQTAVDGEVKIDNTFPTTTTTDNNAATVGVFTCDNQLSGNPATTPNTAAVLPPLTFNEFTLEVIVKPRTNNVISKGYIIGIEGFLGNIAGNAIAFNAIEGKPSGQPNKFFPANYAVGWSAPAAYFTATTNTNPIDVTKFYHVIVTQNAAGLVTTYVNGLPYGLSFMAPGGAKANALGFPHIKICGDDNNRVGFDGFVRAFGFYTESFTNADAAAACVTIGSMVSCVTRIPSKSPTKHPTLSPIPACTLGGNAPSYWIEGWPAFVTGDPHFRMWNGDYHDFQGRGIQTQQFYYMHPCEGNTRDQMPFTMLGKHTPLPGSSFTILDYITLELFDANGDEYLIWLSPTIHHWISRLPTTRTLHPFNPGTLLVDGVTKDLGRRFKARYTQSGTRLTFDLTIGSCTLRLYMGSQGNRGNYLQVSPPQCYKCYTCGLFGDFQRASTGAIYERLRRCEGNYLLYKAGYGAANLAAFDRNGWSWERSYVENTCPHWRRRLGEGARRLQNDEYVFDVDNFIYIEPCQDAQKRAQVINECQIARDSQSTCCNIIGGGFCDQLQEYCNNDACFADDVAAAAIELVTNPIQLVCSLPDAATQLNANLLVEAPGAPTWNPTMSPTNKPTPTPTNNPTHAPTTRPTNICNPCTAANIAQNGYFYPSCTSCCGYIHCDDHGGVFNRLCSANTYWDDAAKICNHNTGQCTDAGCTVQAAVQAIANHDPLMQYIGEHKSKYYGYIMVIGVIAFVLINNVFIGCWCLGKGRNKAHAKFDMVSVSDEI